MNRRQPTLPTFWRRHQTPGATVSNLPPDEGQDPLGLPLHTADRRTNLFGGVGSVFVWDLLKTQAADPFSAVLFCQLEPGGSVGRHAQQRDPEIVLCLDGDGMAEVDGKAQPLGPLAVVFLPLGSELSIANQSRDAPLIYLIIKARTAASAPP